MTMQDSMNTTYVRILEDHPLVRQTLVSALAADGLVISDATADAEQFFASLTPDEQSVALIDLRLEIPGTDDFVDGRTVLRRLSDMHPQVRPIVFSADHSSSAVMECQGLGAWGYLDKVTATAQDIIGAVRSVARGERRFPLHALNVENTDRPPSSPMLRLLSPRERQVLSFISGGADNLKIAAHLGITERTVRAHVSSLYRKLGSENRTQLALLARQLGIHPPPEL